MNVSAANILYKTCIETTPWQHCQHDNCREKVGLSVVGSEMLPLTSAEITEQKERKKEAIIPGNASRHNGSLTVGLAIVYI